MSKAIKYGLFVVLLVLLAALYKLCTVCLAESVDYTASDWLEYRLLTPDEIKNAPQFGDIIALHYRPADGPSPQTSQVEYAGQAADEIRRYLAAIGYHEAEDAVTGEMWVKDKSRAAFITQTEGATKLTFID